MRTLCQQWLSLLHTIQNVVQLCSVHMLVRLCLKSFKLDFINRQTKNFQMYSWVLKRKRNQGSNCQYQLDHRETKGIKEKMPTSGSLTMLKPLTVFRPVTQSCPTLWEPMNCSTPGLPIHHQLKESTQTHVQPVHDAIQPSHPLSSSAPLAPNPSQHEGLFQWVNSSHQVVKVLKFQLQHQSFQWTPRTNLL